MSISSPRYKHHHVNICMEQSKCIWMQDFACMCCQSVYITWVRNFFLYIRCNYAKEKAVWTKWNDLKILNKGWGCVIYQISAQTPVEHYHKIRSNSSNSQFQKNLPTEIMKLMEYHCSYLFSVLRILQVNARSKETKHSCRPIETCYDEIPHYNCSAV